MNKIEKLIEEKCFEGIKYKKLSELITRNPKSKIGAKKAEKMEKGENPFFTSGKTTYYIKGSIIDGENIFVNDGGQADIKYYKGKANYADHVISFKATEINGRYLYHYLMKEKEYINKTMFRGTGIKNINKNEFFSMLIPVPPIEVQKEIVNILDRFTSISTELSIKVSEELNSRKKQYEYYKRKLLKFDKNNLNINWVNLGEYCTRLKGTSITAERMKEIALDNGNTRIFAGGKTLIDTDESCIKKEDIIKIPNIIVQSRGIIDFIYYDKPCSFKKEMWSYTNNNIITLKYIYYYLKNNVEYFRKKGSQMGSMPQISLEITEKYKIPVPPLEEQKRIVSILEKFDKIYNEISNHLLSEIKARQKQYEYYSEKLLNFKKYIDRKL